VISRIIKISCWLRAMGEGGGGNGGGMTKNELSGSLPGSKKMGG
jgi:hypothetical protein